MDIISDRLRRALQIVISFLFASMLGGAVMAALNVLVEFIKGYSPFRFQHLYSMSLWHLLIWGCLGILAGCFFAFLRLFDIEIFKNFPAAAYFMILIVAGILLLYYVNSVLPAFTSLKSLLANLILFTLFITAAIFITNKANGVKNKAFPLLLKTLVVILLLINIFSFSVDMDFFRKTSGQRADYGPTKPQTRPNVVIVVLDAVRSDHLGCYGYNKNTSPNMDAVAAEGVLFENAFAQSSHTAESVPSLLTSTYPSTHNVRLRSMAIPLPHEIITLTSVFKRSGYRTGFFSVGPPVSSLYGYDRNVDDFFEPQKGIMSSTVLTLFLQKSLPFKSAVRRGLASTYTLFPSKYALDNLDPDYVVPKAISWVDDNKHRPFFLYLHLPGGHSDYNPPDELRRMFDSDIVIKAPVSEPPRDLGMYPFIKQASVPARELDDMIALYDAEIRFHDLYIKVFLDYLTAENLHDNTIVILTADHGEEFYDHYGWGHIYSLYDELIKVPLIFYGPGIIPAGVRIDALVAHVDLFPTLLTLCGLADSLHLPYEIEGSDLTALITEENTIIDRNCIFSEVNMEAASGWCLRAHGSKALYLESKGSSARLYFDLINDPLEKNNIFDDNDPKQQRIFQRLMEIRDRSREKAFIQKKVPLDESTKEQLRALGYIK